MKLSKRGEYGLRAMIELASMTQSSNLRVVQIRELAERQNIPSKFLEQILLTVKNTGLLQSKMGVGGGYSLAKPAEEITIGQILRALEGPVAPVDCLIRNGSETVCNCPDPQACGLRMVMQEMYSSMNAVLDGTTLADVVERTERVKSGWLELPSELEAALP